MTIFLHSDTVVPTTWSAGVTLIGTS